LDRHAQWSKPPGDQSLTAAYLAYLPNIGTDASLGPGCLVSFGMMGEATLVWNHLLRQRLDDWIPEFGERSAFLMAEIGWVDPGLPTDLSFTDRLTVRRLTRQPIRTSVGPPR
jgi:hypothetical protein